MLTGDNGILTQAQNAKETTTKAEEEEKIKLAVTGSSISNDGLVEVLDETSFKNELENQFGDQELDVVVNGDGSFIVTVKETRRKYYVNDDKTVINSDNIIEINDAEGLKTFRDDVNNGNSYEGKAVLLTSDITLSGEWEPIGYYEQETDEKNPDTEVNKPFRGIFDGRNNEINGISITTNKSYQGIFSFVIDGTIRNITISKNNTITGDTRVGGVVGYLYGFEGNISNCINYSDVNCNSGGGIVGLVAGQHTVSNCKNYGNITGAGGIVGSSNGVADWPEEYKNYSHKIINCGNYGKISRNANNCGGITGYFKGDIINCFNKNDVTGTGFYASGIAGSLDGKIKNCYNIGNVKGQSFVGGIVGACGNDQGTYIDNCYSIGNITGNTYSDEIIGYIYNNKGNVITKQINCYTKDDTFTAKDLGEAFVDDIENVNGGYPSLYWE